MRYFAGQDILVVGDLILDEFLWGKVDRISPEAPVPVVAVISENFIPGGAANVASNISSLKGCAHIIGLIGSDEKGQLLKEKLQKNGNCTDGIIIDKTRQTTLKTRILAHHQQVVRVDRETIRDIPLNLLKKIKDAVESEIARCRAVIIEDYGKGVITSDVIKYIVSLALKKNIPVIVDPKEYNFEFYKNVTSITPNQFEAGNAANIKITDGRTLEIAGRKILKMLNSESVLITLGGNGMCLFQKKSSPVHIPTVVREVFDVTGAGDTVVAVFTLAVASGYGLLDAARISNFAAGLVVGKIGVATTTVDEIEKSITRVGNLLSEEKNSLKDIQWKEEQ